MAVVLNRSQLAEHMGIALPTVDRWVKEGMPVKQRGSKGVAWEFLLADCIKWWGDRRARDAAGDAPTDIAEIEKRTAQAKMQLHELELAKKRGDVAEIRDFERVQARAMAVVQTNVMNVTARALLQLLGCTDETEFKTKLDAELRQALESAANTDLDVGDEDDESDE